MLRALAYIWALFGAYWIVFAPVLGLRSVRYARWKKLKLIFLSIAFALLLWKAPQIPPVWMIILGLAWALLGLYSVAAQSETPSSEHSLYRLVRLGIGTIAFALLFWNKTGVAFLGKRFLLHNSTVDALGFTITILGLALASWARTHLGRNWSDKVVIQSGHELVRGGPYARLRHPIYSGVLLGIAGTTLVVGEWRALVSLLIMSINYAIKAKREDKILAARFGEEFRAYEQNAGILLRRLRPRSRE